jgi:hypothetical protein
MHDPSALDDTFVGVSEYSLFPCQVDEDIPMEEDLTPGTRFINKK